MKPLIPRSRLETPMAAIPAGMAAITENQGRVTQEDITIM
jgi:hypothetical protein